MKKLLTEFLAKILEADGTGNKERKPADNPDLPQEAKGKYTNGNGRYYTSPACKPEEFIGKVRNGEWIPKSAEGEHETKPKTPETTPSAPQTPAMPQKPATTSQVPKPSSTASAQKSAAPATTQKPKSSDEENPEGTYDTSDVLQKDVVESRSEPSALYKALDALGVSEAVNMFKHMIAGMGGVVASAGESLCTEAQTDLIRGTYKQEEVRQSPEFAKHLTTIDEALKMAGTRGKAGAFTKGAVQKELAQICIKFGLDPKNPTDLDAAKSIFAEAHTYVMEKDKWLTEQPVGVKFKSREDRHSWLRASFYSAYSLRNNGPEDWDRAEGNGRVLKANRRTDGTIKQLLEDNLKSATMAGNTTAMEHYKNELEFWRQFKGYHDTYLVYQNKSGLTSVYHISNKKDDELKDPQNNTTPAKRLENYDESAKEAGFSSEQAQIINTAQNRALAAVVDIDAIATNAWTQLTPEDIKLIASIADRLPSKSQSDVKPKYLDALRGDRDFRSFLDSKSKKPEERSIDADSLPTRELLKMATMYAGEIMQGDSSELSAHFSKFIIKVGQLTQSIFDKKGWSPDKIAAALGNNYSVSEIEQILHSPTMKMLANVKEEHAAGLAGIHKGFIEELHKADGTEIGHDGDNGPAVETYVRGTIKSLHLDTYIRDSDNKIQIEMGGVGVVPKDVRGCMGKLSGFEGETDSSEGRQQLIDHLSKRVKVDSSSDAVYLVGDNGQRTYIASDSWRQAGSSQKVATSFGKHLRECLQSSVQNRLASKK